MQTVPGWGTYVVRRRLPLGLPQDGAEDRKAMTPKERAAKPVTATIASYVDWSAGDRG